MKKAIHAALFGGHPGDRFQQAVYALFRFYCGISIAIGAGLPKVFHKVDEAGGTEWGNLALGAPAWFAEQVAGLGFTFVSPQFWANVAAHGELFGGLLVALGLCTRLAAAQLAFQFFVVAFLWYDEPVPFGMYFQQLIFWAFVLVAAMGGGRFSLDRWLAGRVVGRVATAGRGVAVAGLLLLAAPVFSQKEGGRPRIDFTIANPSLKKKEVDIRCFDHEKKSRIGYGCTLAPLSSRTDNKPLGTRIYLKKRGEWQLAHVLTAADAGRKIDLSAPGEVTREQWLQAAQDEMAERTAALEDASKNPDMEAVARSMGLEMVSFRVSGKGLFGRQAHVRAQLPFGTERTNNGFSHRLSRLTRLRASYPVGTKIYLCEGPYWNGPVAERLVLTVVPEKANHLVRL